MQPTTSQSEATMGADDMTMLRKVLFSICSVEASYVPVKVVELPNTLFSNRSTERVSGPVNEAVPVGVVEATVT